MLPVFQLPNVLPDGCPSNACVTLDVHVVTEGKDNGLNLRSKFSGRRENQCLGFAHRHIDGLKDGYREGRSFTGSRLRLSNDVASLSDG